MRHIWSLCDWVQVCMQSLEVSDECWQVDSPWAWGLHWLPFFTSSCSSISMSPVQQFHSEYIGAYIQKRIYEKIVKMQFIKQWVQLYLVRRMRAAKFSSNSSEILNFIWGDIVKRWWVRGSVIGREIVSAPARHSDTARKVITFTMGCKVTQPFAPPACLLNNALSNLRKYL